MNNIIIPINIKGHLEIQTDHPKSARKQDLLLINTKKTVCLLVDSAVPADRKVKIEIQEL